MADRPHPSHGDELRRIGTEAIDEIQARFPGAGFEIAEAMIQLISGVMAASYALGRRHAMCELITSGVGPDHPKKGLGYRIQVEEVDPETQEVVDDFVRQITDVHVAINAPTSDRLN